jgi:aminocarboxymuconate-semialdehyde decarboxylase
MRSDGPVIDIHCHRDCAPAGALMQEAVATAARAPLSHGSASTQAVNKRQLETLRPKMELLDVRLQDMDQMGVDMQAVAVSVYQYYYWAPPDIGQRVARLMNEELVEATASYSGRFLPLGTVPLQDVDAAIAELQHCKTELGIRGIEIGTHVEGEEISSSRLAPFWAEVERLDMAVVVHTSGHTHLDRLLDYNFLNIVGHAYEATLAIAHLIFDGVMERHPGLKVIIVHGGGYLPAYAGRIDHAWRARADVREALPRPPGDYLRKLYFDSVVFEPDQLRYLIDKYGAEHVMLGTDYPYDMGEDDPLTLIASVPGLTQPQIDLITGGNAATLLGLVE